MPTGGCPPTGTIPPKQAAADARSPTSATARPADAPPDEPPLTPPPAMLPEALSLPRGSRWRGGVGAAVPCCEAGAFTTRAVCCTSRMGTCVTGAEAPEATETSDGVLDTPSGSELASNPAPGAGAPKEVEGGEDGVITGGGDSKRWRLGGRRRLVGGRRLIRAAALRRWAAPDRAAALRRWAAPDRRAAALRRWAAPDRRGRARSSPQTTGEHPAEARFRARSSQSRCRLSRLSPPLVAASTCRTRRRQMPSSRAR